ncbi:MAG: hypothetical protein ACRETL_14755 [Gammaproteobacteria bacterium]
MTERTYTSAIQRLSALPEVFTGSELTVLFGWKSSIASSYLAHWRKAGLVKSLGGRSDVHMNLIRNSQVSPELALRRAFPAAVKVGVDILRAAGWTTQIPTQPEVAVPATRSLHAVNGFELTTRTEKWLQTVKPGLQQVADGIDRLRPAWALADMLARARDRRVKHAWLPDPEDLDLDSVRQSSDLARALPAFALAPDCLDDPGYVSIYDKYRRGAAPR